MATLNDIGIPGIGTGILQPKLAHRYRVVFSNLGGGTDSTPVSMQCVEVARPSVSFQEVKLDRYVSTAYVASKYTFDPCNLIIEDDLAGTASAVLNEQASTQQHLIGAQGPFLKASAAGQLYKFSTTIEVMDGGEQVVESWILEGCFLQSLNFNTLSYQDSEAVKINTVIRFDHARQIIKGHSTRQALGGMSL